MVEEVMGCYIPLIDFFIPLGVFHTYLRFRAVPKVYANSCFGMKNVRLI